MTDRPAFPNSLRYVREQRRLTQQQIAAELHTTVEKIEKLERGEAVPSVKQYENFQAIYGVPDYALASQEQPAIERVVVDLRQSEPGPLILSPKGLKAYFARSQTALLIDGIAQALQMPKPKTRPVGYTVDNIVGRTAATHEILGFDPTNLFWVQHPDLAFRFLRAKIEAFGIYCFMAEAPPKDFRGLFAKLNDRASLIMINKKTFNDKARLFTLIHEFAHFLIKLEGASDPLIANNKAERACNVFASTFLAPADFLLRLFEEAQSASTTVKQTVTHISRRSLLSYGAVAYRLREDRLITDQQYHEWFRAYGISGAIGDTEPSYDDPEERTSGGNWAYNVVTDLGFRPLAIVQKALEQGAIDDVTVGHVINARHATQQLAFKTAAARLAELGL
jgi:Zn-dependent peptidase ImmA (M78 family)/transcriptional regulator with XRE-family HTH domain